MFVCLLKNFSGRWHAILRKSMSRDIGFDSALAATSYWNDLLFSDLHMVHYTTRLYLQVQFKLHAWSIREIVRIYVMAYFLWIYIGMCPISQYLSLYPVYIKYGSNTIFSPDLPFIDVLSLLSTCVDQSSKMKQYIENSSGKDVLSDLLCRKLGHGDLHLGHYNLPS